MSADTVQKAEWFYDHYDPNGNNQWKVRLPGGKVIKVGDQVLVDGRVYARVKQVAGFGAQEHRPVISVLLPGRSVGRKVDISSITKP